MCLISNDVGAHINPPDPKMRVCCAPVRMPHMAKTMLAYQNAGPVQWQVVIAGHDKQLTVEANTTAPCKVLTLKSLLSKTEGTLAKLDMKRLRQLARSLPLLLYTDTTVVPMHRCLRRSHSQVFALSVYKFHVVRAGNMVRSSTV